MKICLLAMGLLCCMSYMINQSRRRIKEKRLNKHLNNLLKYYNKFQIYILGNFFQFLSYFFVWLFFFRSQRSCQRWKIGTVSRNIIFISLNVGWHFLYVFLFLFSFSRKNLNHLSKYFLRERDRLGRKSISVVYVLLSVWDPLNLVITIIVLLTICDEHTYQRTTVTESKAIIS